MVVDVQERLAAAMTDRERLMSRTVLLVRTAALLGVPIVVTLQYPKGLGALEPPVEDALASVSSGGVTFIEKLSFDCFAEPAFVDAVCATGRRQLLVAGMESHICVVQTCLTAVTQGFDVHVAADACCSRQRECHDLALVRLAHAGAVISTAESASYEMVGAAGTEEFRSFLGLVKDAS